MGSPDQGGQCALASLRTGTKGAPFASADRKTAFKDKVGSGALLSWASSATLSMASLSCLVCLVGLFHVVVELAQQVLVRPVFVIG